MKASEIREMNPDELDAQIETIRRKVFDIRTQAVTEKLQDPSLLTRCRKDIARILTVKHERELAAKGDNA